MSLLVNYSANDSKPPKITSKNSCRSRHKYLKKGVIT